MLWITNKSKHKKGNTISVNLRYICIADGAHKTCADVMAFNVMACRMKLYSREIISMIGHIFSSSLLMFTTFVATLSNIQTNFPSSHKSFSDKMGSKQHAAGKM